MKIRVVIFIYIMIFWMLKKGCVLVLYRKNVIYSFDVKKVIIFKINIKIGVIKKNF